MRKYSKAYTLDRLRAFSGWSEKEREDSEELTDESIVYVQDNLTVVKDVFDEEDYIYNDVTEEWKKFCKEDLEFEIPEDLRYAYEDDGDDDSAGDADSGDASADSGDDASPN